MKLPNSIQSRGRVKLTTRSPAQIDKILNQLSDIEPRFGNQKRQIGMIHPQ
jgi:hypothetical protein